MTKFHAVMVDETGCEFGVSVEARSKGQAYIKVGENYPESRCVQMESLAGRNRREDAMYARIKREYDEGYCDDYRD